VSVRHAPARAGEVMHSCLDAGKLRALGWQPAVTLREGLGRTYDHIMGREVAA
jgi:nucleoside-diphosphate-sugar epimerase